MEHLKDICKLSEAIAKDASATKHKALSESSTAVKDKLASVGGAKSASAALPVVSAALDLTKVAIASGGQKALIGRFLKPKKKAAKATVSVQLGNVLGDLAKALSVLQLVIFSHLSQAELSSSGGVAKDAERSVLWVDDHPENNKKEAKAIWDLHHVKVVQEVSTKNAKKHLESNKNLINMPPSHFRIITDKYREGEGPTAGEKLIAFLRKEGYNTPVCIYCSDALDSLETQAKHPRVTVATTSALLNVFVQGMLAKGIKVEEADSADSDEEEEEEVKKSEGTPEGSQKEIAKVEVEEEVDKENGTTTTTTTTTTTSTTKEEEKENNEEKEEKDDKEEEPESAAVQSEDEPTQSEDEFQEEQEKQKQDKAKKAKEKAAKEKEEKEEKAKEKAKAKEAKEKEAKEKEAKEKEAKEKAKEKEAKEKEAREKEKKEKEKEKEKREREELEEKAKKEKEAEGKQRQEEEEEDRKEKEKKEKEKAAKKAKEEEDRKSKERQEKERKEEERKAKEKKDEEERIAKERKEQEKKEEERKEKERKEKEQQEKERKEKEQLAKKKEEEARKEKEQQSKAKRLSGSFNSSFSQDSPSKLWSSDKSAASIVPGSITTFFIRHSTPKNSSTINPGFEVVVIPSNSKYLLEGFVYAVKAGVFGVKFFPVVRGEYKVSVKIGDDHVGNSPFVLTSETQKQKSDEDEDILDMIDKSTDAEKSSILYDTHSNNTSLNTSADTTPDTSMDSNTSSNYKTTKPKTTTTSTTTTTTKKPNAIFTPKNDKNAKSDLLSPFSFVDHMSKSEKDKDNETDESFGSKDASEYEPTQAFESESDTSFESNPNFGKKGVLKPTTSKSKATELVPTQALDDSGAADTEEDSDSETKPKRKKDLELVPTQALDDSHDGDTEVDTEESDDNTKTSKSKKGTKKDPNDAKRKREATGLSDADTEPDNSDSDAETKKKTTTNNSNKATNKKTRTVSMESLSTLPY